MRTVVFSLLIGCVDCLSIVLACFRLLELKTTTTHTCNSCFWKARPCHAATWNDGRLNRCASLLDWAVLTPGHFQTSNRQSSIGVRRSTSECLSASQDGSINVKSAFLSRTFLYSSESFSVLPHLYVLGFVTAAPLLQIVLRFRPYNVSSSCTKRAMAVLEQVG